MDDIKKGIFGVTRAITKGSGTLLKTTKYALSLSNEESKLNSLYTEIGKKVHEIYSYGGSLGEFFDIKYLEIVSQQKKIEELKFAIDVAKGVKTCPKCGKSSPRVSAFCPKCGEDMSETAATEQQNPINNQPPPPQPITQEEPQKTAAKEKICGVCGGANEENSRFCLFCGRIL